MKYLSAIICGLSVVVLALSTAPPRATADELLTPEVAQALEEASSHEYQPPSDGKITEEQLIAFSVITETAAALEEKYMASQQVHEEHHHDHAGGHEFDAYKARVLSLIEALKAEEGNWAEYQWVRGRIEQSLSSRAMAGAKRDEASRHNHALVKAHEDRVLAVLGGH